MFSPSFIRRSGGVVEVFFGSFTVRAIFLFDVPPVEEENNRSVFAFFPLPRSCLLSISSCSLIIVLLLFSNSTSSPPPLPCFSEKSHFSGLRHQVSFPNSVHRPVFPPLFFPPPSYPRHLREDWTRHDGTPPFALMP